MRKHAQYPAGAVRHAERRISTQTQRQQLAPKLRVPYLSVLPFGLHDQLPDRLRGHYCFHQVGTTKQNVV